MRESLDPSRYALEAVDVGSCHLEVALGDDVRSRKLASQLVFMRVRMIGEIAHQGGAHIEAQGGVAFRVVLENSAQVSGEASEAGRRCLSLDWESVLVIDESGAYLGKDSEVFAARSHANAKQAFHHGMGALLSGDEVESAIEADAAGEVVVEIHAEPRQVLAACKLGASVAEHGQTEVAVLRAKLPAVERRLFKLVTGFGEFGTTSLHEVALRGGEVPRIPAGKDRGEAPARFQRGAENPSSDDAMVHGDRSDDVLVERVFAQDPCHANQRSDDEIGPAGVVGWGLGILGVVQAVGVSAAT